MSGILWWTGAGSSLSLLAVTQLPVFPQGPSCGVQMVATRAVLLWSRCRSVLAVWPSLWVSPCQMGTGAGLQAPLQPSAYGGHWHPLICLLQKPSWWQNHAMAVGPLQSFLFETLTERVTKQGDLTSHCFMYLGEQLFQFLLAAFALPRIPA